MKTFLEKLIEFICDDRNLRENDVHKIHIFRWSLGLMYKLRECKIFRNRFHI